MVRFKASEPAQEKSRVPAAIYVSLVDSLYGDSRSMMVGSIAVAGAVLLTAWKTAEPLLYLCAMAFVVVVVIRGWDIRRYRQQRERITTVRDAKRWETVYAVGVSAHVALMGLWCVIAFAFTDDTFVQFVSVVGTIANLIGICGRNFGSTRLVLTW
jgi:uncharacterized membrane protein